MAQYTPGQLKASAPHKAKVKLVIRKDDGEKQEVETFVLYRGLSLDDQADFPSVEGLAGKDRIDVVKKQLERLVIGLPEFGVGPEEEQKADEAYFGAMEDAFVTAISDAIGEDRDPNTKPSDS